MKHQHIRPACFLYLAFLLAPALPGQNPLIPARKEAVPAKDSIVAPVLPYPVPDISMESTETMKLVHKAGASSISETEALGIISGVDSLFVGIDAFLNDSIFISFKHFTGREIDNAGNRVNVYLNQVSLAQGKLSKRYSGLEEAGESLDATKKRWQITGDQLAGSEIPGPLLSRIDMSIRSIDSVDLILRGDMEKLLVQLDRLQDRNDKLQTLRGSIQSARLSLNEHMFRKDMPGFFKDLSSFRDPALLKLHASEIRKSVETDVQNFKSDFMGGLKFMIFLFIGVIIFFYWFRSNYTRVISTEKFEFTQIYRKLINSPLLLTIFTTGLITRFSFPEVPQAFAALNLIILIITMVILTLRIFGKEVFTWMYWLLVVFVLTILYDFLYAPDVIQRILLLFISVTSIVMFGGMLLNKASLPVSKTGSMYKLARNTLTAFIVLLFISIAANLFGTYSMAEFLTLVPIQIAFLVLAVFILSKFTNLVLYVTLASNILLRVNAVSDYFDLIHRKINRFVNLGFWVFFVVKTMQILRIKEAIFEWGGGFLTKAWTIGEARISLRSILIFVFVIWLSLFISKIVRYILERDVFVRVTVSKGIPGTVVMLVRIALIACGFLLAAAAAGMELTNLSIVLGAFSVGIGFGLQNIFNNMVSGLILAFERPINVGDTVQVGELMGTVLNIGLRASRIKSFDGAEVIVPNGNLISESLINWTLSDAYRRMDMRVGVAYGTDPRLVIQIMREVAEAHPLVMQEPPVRALFIGFGDSSLNFRLLAWVDIENRLDVESDLNTTINDRLKEAGIEIPFPQRDLHIRSDDTKPIPGSAEEK